LPVCPSWPVRAVIDRLWSLRARPAGQRKSSLRAAFSFGERVVDRVLGQRIKDGETLDQVPSLIAGIGEEAFFVHFFCLPKRNEPKKKAPKTCPSRSRGVPCASRSRRRSGTRACGPQTPLARFRLLLRCSAASKGYGVRSLYPFGAAEHCRHETDQREDCLSHRRLGVPQRRSRAEARRAVGVQHRPSLGVPFYSHPGCSPCGPACGR